MSKKEIKIVPPEGYEIDKENSTFECIKFKKRKIQSTPKTYRDVAIELFEGKKAYFIDIEGGVSSTAIFGSLDFDDKEIRKHPNNCSSRKQCEKLIAINKLMNVAKYLNGDWKPDWKNADEYKWFIGERKDIYIDSAARFNCKICYFKTRELAKCAIKILGEDTIRLALSTDW